MIQEERGVLFSGNDPIEFDKQHLWHPYTSMTEPLPAYHAEKTDGVYVTLKDGRRLVDGMASWWAAIHGYCHPKLIAAVEAQLHKMPHFMFGGITHDPALGLAERLLNLTKHQFPCIFYADSGSVAVEVALKMALQYWQSRGNGKKNVLATFRGGYHGDTFKAMSMCDPVNGMHQLFESVFQKRYFAPMPKIPFDGTWNEEDIGEFAALIQEHHEEIAAVIVEPIVQGAGGMRFYSPHYLRKLRQLCDDYDILLIFDEIATGFGRTGKLFAYEHAEVLPDILCLGKALTGGLMTMATVMTTRKVAETISASGGVLMHGPTFMGNPLACAAACASLDLLMTTSWQQQVKAIEAQLREELAPARLSDKVADVRVLGTIGVIEMKQPIHQAKMQEFLVSKGVWVRPFGKLLYIMPPYVMPSKELSILTSALVETAYHDFN